MDRNGRLRLDLYDAYGDPLNERIDVYLQHQTLSERLAVRGVSASKAIVVKGLMCSPQGLYRVYIDPPSYLPVSVFVNIREGNKPVDLPLPFVVDIEKVVDVKFPDWSDIAYAHDLLNVSNNVMAFPNVSGEALYGALDPLRRAGLLNILAKSRRTPLAAGGVVLDGVRELKELRGDRFYAVVTQELREQVKNSLLSGLFREVDGSLHRPPDGYSPAGSFKTLDRYGNLQLTFFASADKWMADIDIDDAAGVEHVFQVVRNAITGLPTHPYHIHDILVHHQEIDPGYRFILHEQIQSRTAAGGRRA